MLHRAIVLTCIALVLFVYLLFVTGRKPEDEDVHLVTIDRLPVEVNVVLLGGARHGRRTESGTDG